jgi:PEP-CTERM motif
MVDLKTTIIAGLATIAVSASVAHAQNGTPQVKNLTVQYSGVITNDVIDTLMVRQADGTLTRYTGTVPNYAYKKGDAVTVSFNTTVPTKAFYDANNVPRSADGIYRFTVRAPNGSGNGFGVGNNFDVSGAFNRSADFGAGGLTIVYDSNVESYSLEFPTGAFAFGYFTGPGYQYDANTGALMPFDSCASNDCSATVGGNATDVTLRSPVSTPAGPGAGGNFSLAFQGSWNLPTYGGATQVPEPASIAIFAGGLAILGRARRKRLLKS